MAGRIGGRGRPGHVEAGEGIIPPVDAWARGNLDSAPRGAVSPFSRGRAIETLTEFVVRHGYSILFLWIFLNQLGVPVPAAPYLLAAGALAGLGRLDPALLVGISVVAALPADLLWYELGRRRGMRVIRFLCRVSLEPDSCVRDTETRFARHGAAGLVVAKFVPGVETVAPPLAGVFRMRRSRFLLFDALGTALWSAVFVGLGYLFHDQVDRVAALAGRLGGWLFAVLALLLAAYLAWKFERRRRFLRELRIARITPEELRAKLDAGEEIEIVDVRHSVDFEAEPATIPGARHIAVEEIDDRHEEIPRDREVVLYCT